MRTRREILLGLGAALAWPAPARAQLPAGRPARIGLLRISPIPERSLEALRRGLAEYGYVEGQGFVFVYRFGSGNHRDMPKLAAALVAAGIDVIVTEGNFVTQAARSATTAIPIVMATSPAPQERGLVESLARPGGNVTGNSSQATELTGKLLETIKEIVPGLGRVANIAPPMGLFRAETAAAARILGLEIVEIDLDLSDIDATLRRAAAAQAQAVVVRGRPFFSTAAAKLTIERAAFHRLPAIYESRDFVEMGGLVSYGLDVPDHYRRAATYVAKILKGTKPADLPIEQPNTFELVINLRTAKQLGLAVPQLLLVRADAVIE